MENIILDVNGDIQILCNILLIRTLRTELKCDRSTYNWHRKHSMWIGVSEGMAGNF